MLIVEGLAVLHGRVLFHDRNVNFLQVEVDSKVLVRLISSNVLAHWSLCNVLSRVRQLLQECRALVAHVCREANATSDRFASLHLYRDFFLFFFHTIAFACQVSASVKLEANPIY